MDLNTMKKGICTLKLEGLKKVYNENGEIDPTLVKATFSILDFSVSGNAQQVSKEVALASAFSLKSKPLLCEYLEATDYDNPNDDFKGHGEIEIKLRDGTDYVSTNSHAIGVCQEKGYLGVTKDENGEDVDVLMADFYLWMLRYPNEVSLINQFYEDKEPLYSSCEYFYTSSEVEDGIEIIDKLYFDGHTVLGRNIEPAYRSSKLISFNSKWSKAINQISKNNNDSRSDNSSDLIINKNNKSEKEENEIMTENKFYKALCELSYGDVRQEIMTALSKTMTAETFYNVYVSNYGIYDGYFIYESYENKGYVNYKVPYTKNEAEVVIDLAGKKAVTREEIWVEVSVAEAQVASLNTKIEETQTSLNTKEAELVTVNATVVEMQTQLNEKEVQITEKEASILALNSAVDSTTEEKNVTIEKFNELAETVTSLNSKVKELQPVADIYNKEQYEKSLNTAKAYYKEKFDNVDSADIFELEDTLALIVKSINADAKESQDAKFGLNNLIIANIKPNEEKLQMSLNTIQSLKSTKSLTDIVDEFEQTYGFKRD